MTNDARALLMEIIERADAILFEMRQGAAQTPRPDVSPSVPTKEVTS